MFCYYFRRIVTHVTKLVSNVPLPSPNGTAEIMVIPNVTRSLIISVWSNLMVTETKMATLVVKDIPATTVTEMADLTVKDIPVTTVTINTTTTNMVATLVVKDIPVTMVTINTTTTKMVAQATTNMAQMSNEQRFIINGFFLL